MIYATLYLFSADAMVLVQSPVAHGTQILDIYEDVDKGLRCDG